MEIHIRILYILGLSQIRPGAVVTSQTDFCQEACLDVLHGRTQRHLPGVKTEPFALSRLFLFLTLLSLQAVWPRNILSPGLCCCCCQCPWELLWDLSQEQGSLLTQLPGFIMQSWAGTILSGREEGYSLGPVVFWREKQTPLLPLHSLLNLTLVYFHKKSLSTVQFIANASQFTSSPLPTLGLLRPHTLWSTTWCLDGFVQQLVVVGVYLGSYRHSRIVFKVDPVTAPILAMTLQM